MIFAWQVYEKGEWNLIAGSVAFPEGDEEDGGLHDIVLVTTRRQTADMMGLIAVKHHDATGLPVRLVYYDKPVVINQMEALGEAHTP